MNSKDDQEWKPATAQRMFAHPELTERTIHEAVWLEINRLPEQQRMELFGAVEKGETHPLYTKILQRIRSELDTLATPIKPLTQENPAQTSVSAPAPTTSSASSASSAMLE